jgi:transcription elongation factor GreB
VTGRLRGKCLSEAIVTAIYLKHINQGAVGGDFQLIAVWQFPGLIITFRVSFNEEDRNDMSRGFVKEGDQEEVPMVPQRAYLPEGVPNFVTRTGFEKLAAEKDALISERESLGGSNENERRIAQNLINAKLQLLNRRLTDARVVDPKEQPQDEVTFGATVTIKTVSSGRTQVFQIVGVDEADIAGGKISFISPLARALINKKLGQMITIKREREEILYEIMEISYS